MRPDGESLWKVQCKAMIKRNFLIKWRYRSATVWEFILPVLFMVMFGAINRGTSQQGDPTTMWPAQVVSTGSNVSYLPSYTQLLVAPNNTQTLQVADSVCQRLLCSYTMFADESAAFDFFSSVTNSSLQYPLIGLMFNKSQPFFYTIYYVKERGGDQGTVSYNLADCSYGDNCPASKWLKSGIVSLQAAVDAELIKLANSSFNPPIIESHLMPELQNVLVVNSTLRYMFPLYFVYAMAFLVMYLAYAAVDDKAKNRKDHLTMMGLSPSAYWIAWCVVNIPQAIIISLLGTVILIAFSFFTTAGAYAFFFITVLVYSVNNVLLGICWSTILPKTDFVFFALLGTVALGAIGIINIVLTDYLTDLSSPSTPWPCALICLIPPACTVAILERMFALNVLYPTKLSSDAFLAGNLSLAGMLGILALDVILWTVIAMWFEGIMPNSLGGRLPLCFCFNKKYWNPEAVSPSTPNSHELTVEIEDHSDVEAVPRSMKGKEAVRLFHVKKDFTKSSGCGKAETISAVKDVSLDIYEGQITALLGHNGAGKTTLINMMTGIMPVTSGTTKLYGYDVANGVDLAAIRRMIGVCPQKDVIVDRLTVREHLELFAHLKGVPADEIPGKIKKTVEDCDLVEQVDTGAEKLSGGQKRKLNVGMALIGDPKVLFLDEPTAGMDPYSRRHLWTLLKKNRAGRVILLTTHFMDEADILADRKAVISKGRLQCAGSSLYLKNRFGVGYQLTLLVEDTTKQELLTAAIGEVIPDSTHKRTFGKEITYNLPIQQTVKFADLFTALESQKADLSVTSYSIAMITLEEVFLKLGEEAEEQERVEKERSEGRVITETRVNSDEQGEAMGNPINMTKERVNTSWLRVKYMLMQRLRMVPREGFVIFNMIFYTAALAVGVFLLKNSTSGIVSLTAAPPATLDTNTSLYSADPKFKVDTAFYYNGTSGTIDSLVASLKTSVSPKLRLVEYDGSYRKDSIPVPFGYDVLNYSSVFAASNISIRYNHTYLNSLPLAMNVLSRSLLAEAVGSTPTDTITTTLGEWPSKEEKVHAFNTGSFAGLSFIFAIFMGASLFTIDIVGEKEKKLKPLLRTAGVTVNTYYGTYFLMYMILVGSISIISFIVVVALPVDAFKAPLAAVLFFIHMLIQLVVVLLLSFCWTYAFQRQQSAGNIFNINLWLALVFVTPVTILINIPSVVHVAKILHHVFCFLTPYYGLAGGLLMFTETYRSDLISQNKVEGDVPSVVYILPENGILSALLGGLLWIFLLFVLLRILEIRSTEGKVSDVFKCFSNSLSLYNPTAVNSDNIANEDEDVVAERAAVADLWQQNTHSQAVVMMANKLRRKFSRGSKKADKVAVRNLTFHVEAGQVFGLLGPNGAGKTTVLNMIIAEHSPTTGQVMVDDIEVHSALSDAFTLIGYCPQFDALWQKATPTELMTFIGVSSGYTATQAQTAADYYVKMLKIEEHKDKYIKDLSGGTQRKVSFALSLMGWPRLVLLDEPSTGLDPSSKRFLWDTIRSSFHGHQRAAILTTHYMEEADALCSRIGIMVNGALECIGSSQHIKDKFGDGYQLEIKLRETAEGSDSAMERLKEFVSDTFPQSAVLEEFSDRLQYAMPTNVIDNPGQVFKPLEERKDELLIEEYSFSQSTLEQVFLQFAKLQLEADEDEENADKTRERSHHMLRKQRSVAGESEYTPL